MSGEEDGVPFTDDRAASAGPSFAGAASGGGYDRGESYPRLAYEVSELLSILGSRLSQSPGSGEYDAAGAGQQHAAHGDASVPSECRICPICIAIRMLRSAHPDAAVHLEAAVANLLAAARAVVPAGSPTPTAGQTPQSAARSGAGGQGQRAADREEEWPAGAWRAEGRADAGQGAPGDASAVSQPADVWTRRPVAEPIDITE